MTKRVLSGFVIGCAAMLYACMAEDASVSVEDAGLAEVKFVMDGSLSKGNAEEEENITSLDVFLFRSDGSLDNHSRSVNPVLTDGRPSLSLSVPVGSDMKWQVVANAPASISDGVYDEITLGNKKSMFSDNAPMSLVMTGGGEGIFERGGQIVYVQLKRMVSKISLLKISSEVDIRIDAAYLLDVPESRCYGSPDTVAGRINEGGMENGLNTQTASLLCHLSSIDLAAGASVGYDADFYCYPDPESKVKLVLEGWYDGMRNYYPIVLPRLKENCAYIISEVSILGHGSLDPEDPVQRNGLNYEVSVVPWHDEESTCILKLSLLNDDLGKSSMIYDENRVYDSNVWVFDGNSGKGKGSTYFSDAPFSREGELHFYGKMEPDDFVVIIGNAGKRLQPPADISTQVSISPEYGHDGMNGVLVTGAVRGLSGNSGNFHASVSLKRAMSRIKIKMLMGEYADCCTVESLRLERLPDRVVLCPDDMLKEKTHNNSEDNSILFCQTDYATISDISELNSGREALFYSLPCIYAEAPMYIETVLHFDANGVDGGGEGDEIRRFMVSDAFPSGLETGRSYGCSLSIVPQDLYPDDVQRWHRDIMRFAIHDACITTGRSAVVPLMQKKASAISAGYHFSLDPDRRLLNDGIFAIDSLIDDDGALSGVVATALSPGNSILYFSDSAGNSGRISLCAAVPAGLEATWPEDGGTAVNPYE